MPLPIGITSVIAAMALVALPSHLSPIDSNLASVILLVGLAVGVDYSLFYLRREREERAAGHDAREALDVAAATSGRAVLISGLTVIAAMAGMFFTGDKTFFSFAQGTILVVAIAMFASVTVLPALLAWLGDRVEKGRIPFLAAPPATGRVAVLVGDRRPGDAAAVGLDRARGWGADRAGDPGAEHEPGGHQHRRPAAGPGGDQDLQPVRDAFPAEGVTVDVAVEGRGRAHGPVAGRHLAAGAAGGELEVRRRGTEVTYSDDDTVALISIPTIGNGNDDESTAALNEIRDDIIPATIGRIDGVTVDVSGNAAQSKDFRDLLVGRLPLIFAFVFSLAFLLLLFTFRSIVIPIKAIVLNLLSVGAAYGVLVLVFQDGHLESLLGFNSNGGITSWLPLFLFVLLFGLSMDYHVFILSRVREAYAGA